MQLNYPIQQCPSLSPTNCRSLTLTFNWPLKQLAANLPPLCHQLHPCPLTQVYLIPSKQLIKNTEPLYNFVILGGTFDYLHIGHQILLLYSILLCKQKIIIGVTDHSMLVNKENKQFIQNVQIRKKQVFSYIYKIKPQLIIQTVTIYDPFGPAITEQNVQCIVVSKETIKGGNKINQIRVQKNMKVLKVQVCPIIGENGDALQQKLSSTFIREYISNKNSMNSVQIQKYKQYWYTFVKQLSEYLQIQIKNTVLCEKWYNTILRQYSEYWRFYHTNSHIFYMLQEHSHTKYQFTLSELQKIVVQIGIWFHDIQYVPVKNNNEQVSAETAVKFIKQITQTQNVDKQKVDQLIELSNSAILSTKSHKAQSLCEKVLMDLDMSILDSPPQVYEKYAENVKKQYESVVGELYNQKRAQFLKTLNVKEVFYFREIKNIENNIKQQIQRLSQKQQKNIQEL